MTRGTQVCDRSEVLRLDACMRDAVATLDREARVRARHVVLAAGDANQHWLPSRVAQNRSSHVFVTNPLAALLGFTRLGR